ncbi:adenylate/guanylate cyclase domain-containing protein [Nocardioides aestuarii]|uniref:Adenylate/guanylate cyclase domain-containing protein n=1 Tax=Nocardioides aestuarii TaxID=252231 RepID=A0ABW4TRZ8_9ACTN
MTSANGGVRNPYGSRILGPADPSPRSLRVRVQVLLTATLVLTNVVGAGLVFVISALVVPLPDATRATVVSLAVGVPVYVAFALTVGVLVGTVATVRSLRWALEGRAPTERERRRALRAPLRLTALQFGLWLGATVLFSVLAVVLQPDRTLGVALTVGTASVVVSGVAYLLTGFVMRPVAARALVGTRLTDPPRGVGVRSRALIFWGVGTAAPVVALVVAAVLALAGVGTTLGQLAVATIVVGGVVLVFGFLVTWLAAGSVVAPVRSVRDAMLDLERGQLDREVVVFDGSEVGLLQAGFNTMAGGLREREQLRDLFGRHVGREVARRAADALGEVGLGGEARTASVLFVDLEGSTTYAAEHPPEEVVAVLNRFFGVVVEEVDRREGLVNKFIGDAVLAVFGAPVGLDDHAGRALAAARAIADRLAAELPELPAGIGVATGEVVAGNVGAEERFEYTVIGDAVNSAARLTDLAKQRPGRVLASAASVAEASAGEAAVWQEDGQTTLRGRGEPTATAVPRAG